jgi:hypothetical protein
VAALAIDTLLAGAVIQRAAEDLKTTIKISSSLDGRVGAVQWGITTLASDD